MEASTETGSKEQLSTHTCGSRVIITPGYSGEVKDYRYGKYGIYPIPLEQCGGAICIKDDKLFWKPVEGYLTLEDDTVDGVVYSEVTMDADGFVQYTVLKTPELMGAYGDVVQRLFAKGICQQLGFNKDDGVLDDWLSYFAPFHSDDEVIDWIKRYDESFDDNEWFSYIEVWLEKNGFMDVTESVRENDETIRKQLKDGGVCPYQLNWKERSNTKLSITLPDGCTVTNDGELYLVSEPSGQVTSFLYDDATYLQQGDSRNYFYLKGETLLIFNSGDVSSWVVVTPRER